ncbi:DNA repair protein [Phanerochaete sordida]|uniref:DNA repair protein n=1 Tax=Phanerochaete sordida TaxID=48140 RepID=A0A9P3G6M3_9APHY|nr:DNA repair protein [Phanerochaete sordida]
MSTLLAFHKAILEKIHDPSTSELLLIARGLGLRRLLCKLLQIYDSPQNLIILVNASSEEAAAIGEELGVLGCRKPGLRLVDFESSRRDRQDLYKKGGLISVTSQIFIVDMLTGDIPTHLITGILLLHAEKVNPTSPEAFIARLYREKNKTGFLKAFTDQPEHITSGLSPLRVIMKELQLRTVHVYPRFHQEVSETLGRDRAVLQFSVDMTEYMFEIHVAIVQCMSTTLTELKRSNTQLDLDDLKVENAYFKSFDAIVRRQLDSVWHKVGPKTKQLVSDLSTLRRLLTLLLTEDAFSFQLYLESLIEANTKNEAGNARQNQSPWMMTEAANVIFQYAKRRCYTIDQKARAAPPLPQVADENEDEWDAIRELEGGASGQRSEWPEGVQPVLEELPKWSIVAEALQEIEEEMMRRETKLTARDPGSNTVLIMTSSIRSAQLLREFLGQIDPSAEKGAQGRKLMEENMRSYLARQAMKKAMQNRTLTNSSGALTPSTNGKPSEVSEALKRKDREREARIASRRRIRGGAPAAASTRSTGAAETLLSAISQQDEAIIAALPEMMFDMFDPAALLTLDADFDTEYGMLAPEQTVIVRAYSDDSDDTVLSEIQPRYVIMYEPNLEFTRRLEVYKRSMPGLGVRVYLMLYNNSCEEAKYLTDVRREKDAFERLIKERGSMLMPILDERRPADSGDNLIRTISTRMAGGRKDVTAEPTRVIVDMREFRSSLPSLLHNAGILVVPATLTVGDYVLTPDMCVERKSIPDLVSSFNSGRLYTQCEMMSAHYKHPILLIEWEENKSFSLEAVQEIKSYAKSSNKYQKKKPNAMETTAMSTYNIQAKLVLLTLTFPRVRIIWSSSPYATTAMFSDLKAHNFEPDAAKAIAVGAEEDGEGGPGTNHVAEELLRTLPGVSAQGVRHIMNKVGSVREFCELSRKEMQEILGVEPGKTCYEFVHRGERRAPAKK